MPDDKQKEQQISDEEITKALEQNTKWRGSTQRMWAEIEAKLQPVPWYKRRRNWMPALAAAMILVLILATQGNPPLPPLADPNAGQTETLQSEDTVTQLRTMAAFEQSSMDKQTAGQVAIGIGLTDVAEAGAELNLELSLTAAEGIAFAMETPMVRLLHTDRNGLFTIVAELSIESLNQEKLAHGTPLSGIVSLTAPHQPGSYLVEVSISGTIDGQPVFFGETKSLMVIENPKEE